MSLANQLAAIAPPTTSSAATKKRNTRASIIYSPRDAADISLDQLHETAIVAFQELCKVDPSLEQFEAPLFSTTARNTNRELSDAATNAQLDLHIAHFARAISPYFLLNYTPHVLEYLVRRFEIHLYNVESVLECILPFHETALFAKILPLLALQTDARWSFLQKAQLARVPMARQIVVDALVRNVALVDFVWSMAQRVIGSDDVSGSSSSPSSPSSLSTNAAKSTLTFSTVVLVETSRRVHAYGGETASNYVRRTLPHLLHAISHRRSLGYATMGFILATQLCRSFAVSSDVHDALASAVAKSLLRDSEKNHKKSSNKKNNKKNKNNKNNNSDASLPVVLHNDPIKLRRALTCLASMHTSCDGRTAGSLPLTSEVVKLLSSSSSSLACDRAGAPLTNDLGGGKSMVSHLLVLRNDEEAPILSISNEYIRSSVGAGGRGLFKVMSILEHVPSGHLLFEILTKCVSVRKATEKTQKNRTTAMNQTVSECVRRLSRWYPDDTNVAIRAVVGATTASASKPDSSSDEDEENENENENHRFALSCIVDIFAGTRFRPVDNVGTSLYMALRHPSPELRLSGIRVLATSAASDSSDDDSSVEDGLYLFRTFFNMIANDVEPAVVAEACVYVETTQLWNVVSNEGGELQMAVTSVCRAMERWSTTNSTLMCLILNVASGLAPSLTNERMALRPLTRRVASLLPRHSVGTKAASSSSSSSSSTAMVTATSSTSGTSAVGSAAIRCAIQAGLFSDNLNVEDVEDVVENIADEILLKARDEVDEAVRRYIFSVCSEPTLSTSVTVPKGEWLLMEALCVALDKQISKNEITITTEGSATEGSATTTLLASLLLEYTVPRFVTTYYHHTPSNESKRVEDEGKYILPRCYEVLSKHYAAVSNTAVTSSSDRKKRKRTGSSASATSSSSSHTMFAVWQSFVSARRLPASSTGHSMLVFLLVLASPRTMSSVVVLQQLMLSFTTSVQSTVQTLLSFVARRCDIESARAKQAPWTTRARAACLELTRLHWMSSAAPLLVHGVDLGSVLVAMQSSNTDVRKSASRCIFSLLDVSPKCISSIENQTSIVTPSTQDLLQFITSLQEKTSELLTDRYYLRQAVAKQLISSKGSSSVPDLFRWILSECSLGIFLSDPRPAALLFRTFEAMEPTSMIETAGAPIINMIRKNKTNNEPDQIVTPDAEMVRIILSQYQRIMTPKQFTPVAFEILQLLLKSEWVLDDTGRRIDDDREENYDPNDTDEEKPLYIVRDDALATLTSELCTMMHSEQNDDTFLLLVELKKGRFTSASNPTAKTITNQILNKHVSPIKKRKTTAAISTTSSLSMMTMTSNTNAMLSTTPRSSELLNAAIRCANVSDGLLMDMLRKIESSNNYTSVDQWLNIVTITSEIIGMKSSTIKSEAISVKIGHLLIKCLNDLIKVTKDGVNNVDTTTRSQREFACVLLLSATHQLFGDPKEKENNKKLNEKAAKKKIEIEKKTVKTIVKCIQWTASSQVRNTGLSLLSLLALNTSNAVLSCLIPVFSFIGKDLATASEDNYTFNVVRKILQVVVPNLKNKHMYSVMNVFVNAFDTMLPHRRLELFNAMINSMKGKQTNKNGIKNSEKKKNQQHQEEEKTGHAGDDILSYLVSSFVSTAILMKKEGPVDENVIKTGIAERMKCCHDICGSFHILDQIDMIKRLVHVSTTNADDDQEDDEDSDSNSDSDVTMKNSTSSVSFRSTKNILSNLPILQKYPKALQIVKKDIIVFINNHLSKKSFLKKLHQLQLAIKKRNPSGSAVHKHSKTTQNLLNIRSNMETYILSSCELLLNSITDTNEAKKYITDQNMEDEEEEEDRILQQSTHHEILGKMCSMLTVPSFVVVITALLDDSNSMIRQRALVLLNERVIDDQQYFDSPEINLFLELVDELSMKAFPSQRSASVASDSSEDNEDEDSSEDDNDNDNEALPPHVLQCYLYSLGILTTAFAGAHPKRFVHMLVPLSNVLKKQSNKLSIAALRSTTFSTLASLCTKLGPLVLPTLPILVPSLMTDITKCISNLYTNASEEQEDENDENEESTVSSSSASSSLLLRGALSSLLLVLKHIPQFMTPYLRTILIMVFSDITNTVIGNNNNNSTTTTTTTFTTMSIEAGVVEQILECITKAYNIRILLPILNTMISNANTSSTALVNSESGSTVSLISWSDSTITRIFDGLTSIIEKMTTKEIRLYYKDLHSLCLNGGCETCQVEWSEGRDSIVECLVTIMLKLSERRMKPMFISIVEWSVKKKKQLFLYSLIISLSSKLKSIFTPFYEYIMLHITRDMSRFNEGRGEYAISEDDDVEGSDSSDEDSSDDGDGRNQKQGGRKKKRRKKEKKKSTQKKSKKSTSSLLEYERIEMATQCMLNCFTFDNAATTANVKDYGTFIVTDTVFYFFFLIISFITKMY